MTNSPTLTKTYRQHYYAAVSWADFVAGQVLDELDALGLTENTLVVMHRYRQTSFLTYLLTHLGTS